eukprot:scaffold91735_cov60-Phaeocystis_antarctica.AAC.10
MKKLHPPTAQRSAEPLVSGSAIVDSRLGRQCAGSRRSAARNMISSKLEGRRRGQTEANTQKTH